MCKILWRLQGKVPQNRNIIKDQLIRLAGVGAAEKCRHHLRRVEVWVPEKNDTMVLLTNNLKLGASTISAIYRDHWEVESFFKMLKQNLRVKTFVGTSANALHFQLWTALIAILLLKYLKFRSRMEMAFSNLVALVRMNLFAYKNLWRWLDDPFAAPPEPEPAQPMLPFLDINIFVGGVTFEDGTVNKHVTKADFDSSGEFRFRFIMANGVSTSTCHTVNMSQGGTGL